MPENKQSNNSENVDESDVNDKCKCYLYSYEWSLNGYHAIFCPARIKALFVPKIDQDLMKRFLETFELDEKYFIALSMPTLPNIIKLEPLQILNSYYNDRNSVSETTPSVVTVLNNSFTFHGNDKMIFDLIKSKTLICFPRIIDIDVSLISSQIVLLLLSTYTKKLKLENSFCQPNLAFADIIKNAPNLESISTYESPLIIDNKWIDEMLQYKKGKNFRFLNITIKTAEMIDVESLKTFVRTKCTKNVLIKIAYPHSRIQDNCAKQLNQILLKHFGKIKNLDCDNKYALPRIRLDFNYGYDIRVFPLHNPEDIKNIQNENGSQKLYI